VAFPEKDEKSQSIELGINACDWDAVMEGRSLDILDPLPPGALPEDHSGNFAKNITTNFVQKKN
jgi:hypothetical protein